MQKTFHVIEPAFLNSHQQSPIFFGRLRHEIYGTGYTDIQQQDYYSDKNEVLLAHRLALIALFLYCV
jgi:hypothetical protein